MNAFGFLATLLLAALLSGAVLASDTPAAAVAETAETDTVAPQIAEKIQDAVQDAARQQADPYAPPMPKVIADAAARGVQVQYLGNRDGFTGWILLDKAGATYNYVSADGNTIFQGMMYDGAGTPLTVGQVATAQKTNPGFFSLAGIDAAQTPTPPSPTAQAQSHAVAQATKTPAEQLYYSLGYSNFVKLGNPVDTAPIMYAFMDPDCAHCHDFLKEINTPYLASNTIQLRVIPIGVLGEESKRRAAYTLTQPDGGAQFLAHALEQKTLPAPQSVMLEGQQLNVDLFRNWRFDGTPILVYKEKSGRIMMVRGGPNNMKAVVDSILPGAAS